MRKINLIRITVAAFFIFFLQSCNYYKPVEAEGIKGIKLHTLTGNTAEFTVQLKVKNPNSYIISIKDYKLDIFLNEKKVGEITGSDKIKLAADTSKVYNFPANIKFGNIFTGAAVLLNIFTKKKIKVKTKGFMTAKVMFFSKKIEIDQENTVDLTK